jgi:hypothetical protein
MKTILTTSLVLDIFELLVRTDETLLDQFKVGGFKDVLERLKKELNDQIEPFAPKDIKYFVPKDSDSLNPGLINPIIGPNSWDWKTSSGLTLTTEQIEVIKKSIPTLKVD